VETAYAGEEVYKLESHGLSLPRVRDSTDFESDYQFRFMKSFKICRSVTQNSHFSDLADLPGDDGGDSSMSHDAPASSRALTVCSKGSESTSSSWPFGSGTQITNP
jgi:hypothetical protein